MVPLYTARGAEWVSSRGEGRGGPAVCRASVLCRHSETAGLTFVSHPSSDYLLVMSVPAHQQPDGLTLAALTRGSPERLQYWAVRGPICLLQLPRHLPVWVLETSAQPQSRALERIFPVLCLEESQKSVPSASCFSYAVS